MPPAPVSCHAVTGSPPGRWPKGWLSTKGADKADARIGLIGEKGWRLWFLEDEGQRVGDQATWQESG